VSEEIRLEDVRRLLGVQPPGRGPEFRGPSHRDLVDEKLNTAGELYQAMAGEFHQARAFLLEAMVVAILIIELVFLFRGKS
jgi:hypothetical protein